MFIVQTLITKINLLGHNKTTSFVVKIKKNIYLLDFSTCNYNFAGLKVLNKSFTANKKKSEQWGWF